MYTVVPFLLAISLMYPVLNLTIQQLDKDKHVVAPQEKFLLVVASQPECPLQLEHFRLLLGADLDVQPKFEFRIRNIGKKPIVRYTVSYRTSKATGGTIGGGQSLTKALLPNEVASGSEKEIQVVPLSDEIRLRLNLEKEEQILIVLMIENVVFDDGSSYNAAATSKTFFDFFLTRL